MDIPHKVISADDDNDDDDDDDDALRLSPKRRDRSLCGLSNKLPVN